MSRRAHALSRPTLDAVAVLGTQIASARRKRRWTAAELADRAGISVTTMRNVERGTPTVAIGVVFELATLLGVPLFGVPANSLGVVRARAADQLALLPQRVYESMGPVDDDF